MTVIRVGEKLGDQYKVGDRFAIQPDVWYGGKSIPYSFGMDGAYRQYGVIGKEVLRGDEGSYLIPIPDGMSYAAAALTEPWGCVEAAYRMLYRSELQAEGNIWFYGNERTRGGYRLDRIWNRGGKPDLVVVTDVPDDLEKKVSALCARDKVAFRRESRQAVAESGLKFHDIIVLDGNPQEIDEASLLVANDGILAMTGTAPLSGPIKMDFGRVHYDNILYVGTISLDLDAAYHQTPARCTLKAGGSTLMLGAAGPMGRMHLQRAIESAERPSTVVATDIEDKRLNSLRDSFLPLAQKQNVELCAVNPLGDKSVYDEAMEGVMKGGGFDDVEVMVTSLDAINEVTEWIATGGVINLFAGLKRGTIAEVDAFLIFGPRQLRYVGHSGLKLVDQVAIVSRYESGELQPHRSVAAICGMRQIPDGIRAMQNATYPGKIVAYPMVADFPLTGLAELKNVLPEVYRALEGGSVWTNTAERLFLERMLSPEE
jgi:threonine dehydrogenase-like Zn-dependent dehydrogenase